MPPVDWDECARKMDDCEKLEARVHSLEAAVRRRAQRAHEEGDIGTLVHIRDGAHEANVRKAERADIAQDLAADLARAQKEQTAESLRALTSRLDSAAEKSRQIIAIYEGLVEWGSEPS
jgi:hypothetical protein